MMQPVFVVFPCDPCHTSLIDEAYADEADMFEKAGANIVLWNMDAPHKSIKEFKCKDHCADGVAYWRGWMLKDEVYYMWYKHIQASGLTPVVDLNMYLRSHHLPQWYDLVSEWTMPTDIYRGDLNTVLHQYRHPSKDYPVMVKDFVKSHITPQTPLKCETAADVERSLRALHSYRHGLEGGACIRQYIDLDPTTEQRIFVIQGKAFCDHSQIDEPTKKWLKQIINTMYQTKHVFSFALDWAYDTQDKPWLIEIGDAGVSSFKTWGEQSINRYVEHLVKTLSTYKI